MQDAPKRPSSKAGATEEAGRMLSYVELLSDVRTPAADFFSILLKQQLGQEEMREQRHAARKVANFNDLATCARCLCGRLSRGRSALGVPLYKPSARE
jgi:hypothetical protein